MAMVIYGIEIKKVIYYLLGANNMSEIVNYKHLYKNGILLKHYQMFMNNLTII